MNTNTAKVRSLIENAFASTVEKLAEDKSGNFMGDLHVQADTENGELQIYDDEEHLVEKIVIFNWMNSNEEENAFNKQVAAPMKTVLTILSTKNIFGVPRFMRPPSVSLTDEDFAVIEELPFIDDDMLRLDDLLLKDLDADLDGFLANLLTDVK